MPTGESCTTYRRACSPGVFRLPGRASSCRAQGTKTAFHAQGPSERRSEGSDLAGAKTSERPHPTPRYSHRAGAGRGGAAREEAGGDSLDSSRVNGSRDHRASRAEFASFAGGGRQPLQRLRALCEVFLPRPPASATGIGRSHPVSVREVGTRGPLPDGCRMAAGGQGGCDRGVAGALAGEAGPAGEGLPHWLGRFWRAPPSARPIGWRTRPGRVRRGGSSGSGRRVAGPRLPVGLLVAPPLGSRCGERSDLRVPGCRARRNPHPLRLPGRDLRGPQPGLPGGGLWTLRSRFGNPGVSGRSAFPTPER